jgi:hypothetical protein
VDVQHDRGRLFLVLLKEALQDVDDKFHGRVVVVQQQHTVKRWLFCAGDSLGSDAAIGPAFTFFVIPIAAAAH